MRSGRHRTRNGAYPGDAPCSHFHQHAFLNFAGTLSIIAVDYFDRPPETWYNLQLPDSTRVSLDVSIAEELPSALFSGATVKVAGSLVQSNSNGIILKVHTMHLL